MILSGVRKPTLAMTNGSNKYHQRKKAERDDTHEPQIRDISRSLHPS
jgi:hypothetical protein